MLVLGALFKCLDPGQSSYSLLGSTQALTHRSRDYRGYLIFETVIHFTDRQEGRSKESERVFREVEVRSIDWYESLWGLFRIERKRFTSTLRSSKSSPLILNFFYWMTRFWLYRTLYLNPHFETSLHSATTSSQPYPLWDSSHLHLKQLLHLTTRIQVTITSSKLSLSEDFTLG